MKISYTYTEEEFNDIKQKAILANEKLLSESKIEIYKNNLIKRIESIKNLNYENIDDIVYAQLLNFQNQRGIKNETNI